MAFALVSFLLALLLILLMLGSLEIGRRLGLRRIARFGEDAAKGIGAIEGAIFGLLGLLIAFTFSGASQRFDTRRALVVQEANAIGTAFLRLDLLDGATRTTLRQAFRDYLDTRLAVYRALPDLAAAQASIAKSGEQQIRIWRLAVAACRADPSPAPCALTLPALNEMFDITTTRTTAGMMHPPTVIYVMLFGVAAGSALLAGYGMAESRSRRWMHMVGLAATMGISVYVILDIEFPRLGLIRVDAFDQILVNERAWMDQYP